jgi:hypothetical protein
MSELRMIAPLPPLPGQQQFQIYRLRPPSARLASAVAERMGHEGREPGSRQKQSPCSYGNSPFRYWPNM